MLMLGSRRDHLAALLQQWLDRALARLWYGK